MRKLIILLATMYFIHLSGYTQNISYYISASGDDSNNGMIESSPWHTLEHVSAFNFQPRYSGLFRCGDVWRGR